MNSSFTQLALLSYVVKIRLGEKNSSQARCEREREKSTFLCHFLWDTFYGTLFWDTFFGTLWVFPTIDFGDPKCIIGTCRHFLGHFFVTLQYDI